MFDDAAVAGSRGENGGKIEAELVSEPIDADRSNEVEPMALKPVPRFEKGIGSNPLSTSQGKLSESMLGTLEVDVEIGKETSSNSNPAPDELKTRTTGNICSERIG